VEGSSPSVSKKHIYVRGLLAQLVEHVSYEHGVASSSLAWTKKHIRVRDEKPIHHSFIENNK
ncbi:MAG: hypothetical protein RLZZ625_504, partial [Pseudomonadota bacterium]